jgi:3-oxoadipate enol-lactonase
MTPVVFLHGFPYGPAMWDAQVKAVNRPVWVPELLGYPLEQAAAQVILEMDRLGWEKASIVALSMGGYIAFRLWELAPERIHALVLANTRATPDPPQRRLQRLEQIKALETLGIESLVESALATNLGQTAKSNPELVSYVRQQLKADPVKAARSLRAMADRPDSVPMLESISVPTLVIVGEEDTLTPLSDAQQIAQIPKSQLRIIPKAGHMSNLENPEAFNQTLLDFLALVD